MAHREGSDELIYLASPYNHPDEKVRIERFKEIVKISARLMKRGWIVYSPIVHNHPIAALGRCQLVGNTGSGLTAPSCADARRW